MKQRCLIYCCKEKNKGDRLVRDEHYGKPFYLYGAITENFESLNGKIVCECEVETEKIKCVRDDFSDFIEYREYHYITKHLQEKELIKHSCVDFPKLQYYLRLNNGYALHISNIKVFDKPKDLWDFWKIDNLGGMLFTSTLHNAPQNMMRVSVNYWEYAECNPSDIRVLISIQPQWVCKILNHEKDIEVRRKVLKGMVE